MIVTRGLRPLGIGTAILVALMLLPPLLGPIAGIVEVCRGTADSPTDLGFRGGVAALVTLGWSVAIGTIASALGLGPGRRLAIRPRPVEAVGWTVPLLVAPALLFDAWWIGAGPDGAIGAIAAEHGLVSWLRAGVLALGLLGVALPLAVWAHAATVDPTAVTLRRLDRPRGAARWRAGWRLDAGPVARVAVLVALIVAGLTVPFDLAQVGSWGFELRTLDTRGAGAGTLWRAGWAAVIVAIVAGGLLARRLPGGRGRPGRPPRRLDGGGFGLGVGCLVVVVPLMLLARRGFEADPTTAWRLHAPAVWNTLLVGVAGFGLGAAIATHVAVARLDGRGGARWSRLVVGVAAVVAFLPATLVAIGVEASWNRSVTAFVYDGPIAMMLAVGARVAVVPAVLGHLAVPAVGRVGGGPVALDAPRRGRDAWRAAGSAVMLAASLGGLAGAVLAMSEIPVTARLQPPGFPMISAALLHAMHYQYVDSVLPVALPPMLLAVPVAMMVGLALRRSGRCSPGSAWAGVLVAAVLATNMPGCDRSPTSSVAEAGPVPVSHEVAFGRPGNLDGRFDYPRAIAVDAARDRIFVVDKSARVQRFGLDGTFETAWTMPRFENGKPTGISIAPDGRVVVADTHEHRIAIFTPDGELLATHGRMGREPGEFIYPTDIAAGPDGRWYVSEYGGNDRVQIFDPDWRPIGVIGFAGETDEATRPALSRPQSIVWHEARGELFIADAIHHRIVVVDADGRLRRTLGGPGLEPGRFSYPYGIAVDRDGTLVVVEFGANRIQRIDPEDGRSLAVAGGTGVEPGRLRYPWAIDVDDGVMALLDSGNARVLVGSPPAAGTGSGPGREDF